MTDGSLRIALLHYADVNNYGDVLFPLLAEQELKSRLPGVQIDFICATGRGPLQSTRYDQTTLDHDAIVIAGGELLHRRDDILLWIYKRFGYASIPRPTDLVFDWTKTQGPYKAWVGLGMLEPDEPAKQSIREALPNLDMIAARDTVTRQRLSELGRKPADTSDLGWLFPRLTDLRPQPVLPKKPYAIVQMVPAHAPKDMAAIVEPLKELQRQGLEVALLPITSNWGDEESLRYLSKLTGYTVIEDKMHPLQKLHVLANCQMSITQSMHGFVTTLAAGRPAGLIWPRLEDKFSALLSDTGLEDLRKASWTDLPTLIESLYTTPIDRITTIRDRCVHQASETFDTLAANIKRHVALNAARRP